MRNPAEDYTREPLKRVELLCKSCCRLWSTINDDYIVTCPLCGAKNERITKEDKNDESKV